MFEQATGYPDILLYTFSALGIDLLQEMPPQPVQLVKKEPVKFPVKIVCQLIKPNDDV